MSQNRSIKDFFLKAPNTKAPAKRSPLPDKTTKNQPRSTSSRTARKKDAMPHSIAPKSVSTNSKVSPRKPAPLITEPAAARSANPSHESSSASLSSVPASFLAEESQNRLPQGGPVGPSPQHPNLDSVLDDGTSSSSFTCSDQIIVQIQTSSLAAATAEPPLVAGNMISSSNRVIEDSDDEDDEDDDSDSLPDLFASKPKRQPHQSNPGAGAATPMTPPRATRGRKMFSFHSSPLTVQPRYAFDLKALQKQSRMDDAAEETSKRLKTMMEAGRELVGDSVMDESVTDDDQIVDREELVDLLVEDLDEERAAKHKAVLERTKETVTELRYYFFNTQSGLANGQRRESQLSDSPRPRSSTAESWIFGCLCGEHGKTDDGTLSIACDTCNRWQHNKCVGISRTMATRPDFVFICKACKERQGKAGEGKFQRPGSSFPVGSITKDWAKELKDPKVRHQTFTTGFAENMVRFGKTLPDELFIWLLDEICFERSDLLRHSYCGVLEESPNQIYRLMDPEVIQSLFRSLGGTPISTILTESIKSVKKIPDPYPKQDWANLRSFVKFLGRVARDLSQETRLYIMGILLRMGADSIVMSNIGLLESFHETLISICQSVPDKGWEAFCQAVCKTLFTKVGEAILRFQITKCIPCSSPQTQDLKRRFAAASFFEDISYCDQNTYLNNDINRYTNYLSKPIFTLNQKSNFHDIGARISLLDIAIDDGQYDGLDLDDRKVVKEHNKDIEMLGTRIKAISQAVPTSRISIHGMIEAKVALELVLHRVLQTLKISPKAKPPKKDLFSMMRKCENLEEEKSGMANFLIKKPAVKKVGDFEDEDDASMERFLRSKRSMGL